MSIPKRKGERVFDSSHDSSHPAPGGNLVLLNEGAALYNGDYYYRDGYAPQSAVKPGAVVEPTPEPEYVYRTGDRVRVTDGTTYPNSVPAGSVGTVNEDARADEFFGVTIDHDSREWMFAAEEVEPAPETTHRHPEGLYREKYNSDFLVLVKHEAGDGAYEIRYISDANEDGLPTNSDMDDDIVGMYELVSEFPVK